MMALAIESLGQAMAIIDQLNRALAGDRAAIATLCTQLAAAQKVAEDRGAEVERLRAKTTVMREIMIHDAVQGCSECGSREFPREPDCESCTSAVDERIATVLESPAS